MNPNAVYSKPPRGRKPLQHSLKTINLGLHYNLSAPLVEQHARNSDGFCASSSVGHVWQPTACPVSIHKFPKNTARDLYFGPVSFQHGEQPGVGNHAVNASVHKIVVANYGAIKTKYAMHNVVSSLGDGVESDASKGASPVASAHDGDRFHENRVETKSLPNAASSPGDRVLFADSPSMPGVPIVYRLADERQSNPDKLNLDRRGLSVCPLLEGEENLRLLNLQHNSITRIQNLSCLRKLIFLDLYDNQIDEISGLGSLKSLRVLMLGKNRIKRITNLTDLSMLDVLDLHGNKIAKIEGLSHLHQLRVLNLAGNELKQVKNVAGLQALCELNLRRNCIESVSELDLLPSLQRLFLSFNDIKRYSAMECLGRSVSLLELSLDGNPISLESNYKQVILQNVQSVRQLDMKRITDEERRIAVVMAKKEEERKRESEKMATLKERRRLAINNAQRQWDIERREANDRNPSLHEPNIRKTPLAKVTPSSSLSTLIAADGTDYSVCHLAEVDGDQLCLFGPGALGAIDRNWGEKIFAAVTSATFKYIDFDLIVPHLCKLSQRFSSLEALAFEYTNISSLPQLNGFVCVKRLDRLDIHDQGNSITSLSLWKPYAIFRLSHLNLRNINGCQVTSADVVHAEKLFGPLCHVTTSQLSQTRLLLLLAKQRKGCGDMSGKVDKSKPDNRHDRSASGETVCKAGLTYHRGTGKNPESSDIERAFASNFIRDAFQDSAQIDRKRAAVYQILPEVIRELVRDAFESMNSMESYTEDALSQIKKMVGVSIA